jgi:hypothetical protein
MTDRFLRNVIIKGFVLFVILNLLLSIMPAGIGKISLYNLVLDGRPRFPFGENPMASFNLSMFDLDAMFASHIIAGREKSEDEFRVIMIGDSATWGTLLRPEETLTGLLDAENLTGCGGLQARFYNLGYPTVSLTKDLIVLDYALRYEPDMIIWRLTLESFLLDKQLSSPIVANNASRVTELITRYDLPLDADDPALVHQTFWDRTLLGQRRPLADLVRLQLLGVPWSATGIDQIYPDDYTRAQVDFDEDVTYHGQPGPALDDSRLLFSILETGLEAAGDIPVLLINEPILVSHGENSDLRYNFMYPRWAYDDWLGKITEAASLSDWNFINVWDLVSAEEFTNSAIHMTPVGEEILMQNLIDSIWTGICP